MIFQVVVAVAAVPTLSARVRPAAEASLLLFKHSADTGIDLAKTSSTHAIRFIPYIEGKNACVSRAGSKTSDFQLPS